MSKVRDEMAINYATNQGIPHGKRNEPAWVYSDIDFKQGWDAALKHSPEVLALVFVAKMMCQCLAQDKAPVKKCFISEGKTCRAFNIIAAYHKSIGGDV